MILPRAIIHIIIWKKKNSKNRQLRKNSELQVRYELMTLRVVVWTL